MSAEGWQPRGLQEMLVRHSGQISSRKLDLFNCWCCQVLRPYLTDRRSIAAARFAERNVDEGWPNNEERLLILAGARQAVHDLVHWEKKAPTAAERRKRRVYLYAALVAKQTIDIDELPSRGLLSNAKYTAYVFGWANDDGPSAPRDGSPDSEGLRETHLHMQEAVFRDIVGDADHPITFDPRWRTSDVVGVARGIYDDKVFVRMPILADALMDAGCEDEQVISHCCSRGPHVRGCWVVDLVLSRE